MIKVSLNYLVNMFETGQRSDNDLETDNDQDSSSWCRLKFINLPKWVKILVYCYYSNKIPVVNVCTFPVISLKFSETWQGIKLQFDKDFAFFKSLEVGLNLSQFTQFGHCFSVTFLAMLTDSFMGFHWAFSSIMTLLSGTKVSLLASMCISCKYALREQKNVHRIVFIR